MKVIHTTAKAILFEDDNGKFWCPKAMCLSYNSTYMIAEDFDVKYLVEETHDSIEGEDISFEPIATVLKTTDLSEVPVKELEKIFIPDSVDRENYNEDVDNGYDGTYAEWCSLNIPF